MEYGTPSTPEEIAACDSSPNGVICVLKDLGSKFGESIYVFVLYTLLLSHLLLSLHHCALFYP